MNSSLVATKVTTTDCPYTNNNLHPHGYTGQLIMEDSLFVIQAGNLDLLQDACSKDVIICILFDKIEEITVIQAVAIKDDPNALRFLCIISNTRILEQSSRSTQVLAIKNTSTYNPLSNHFSNPPSRIQLTRKVLV